MLHRMRPHFRGRLAAALAAPLIAAPAAALAAVAPAAAVTCPAGSTTWHTTTDANGDGIAQTADDFGTGAITCFKPGTAGTGAFSVTQADHSSNPIGPTSFPSNQYGCSVSYCTTGWTSELWSTPAEHITVNFDNTGVSTSDVYDYLIDQFMTTSTGAFSTPSAEVEIILSANLTYSGIGVCASTSCDPTGPHTINGVTGTWWESKGTTSGGWPDYLFVRSTMQHSVSSFCLKCFRTAANNEGSGGNLGSWKLGYEAPGFELWPRTAGDGGVGLNIVSSSVTSLP